MLLCSAARPNFSFGPSQHHDCQSCRHTITCSYHKLLVLGVSDVYTQPCSNGFHPYTNGLSCIQFEVDQSLNYSSALLLQTAQNNNYGLAEAITTIDLRTLSTYAASILADNSSYTPLWVSDSNVNGNMMDCPALLNETIELLNCSLELGYIVQISYNSELLEFYLK